MAIPYFVFGIPYLIGLCLYLVFFLFNLYHLRRFGFFDFTAVVVTGLVSCVLIIVLTFTVIFLRNVAWFDDAELFGTQDFTNVRGSL